jgi:hypothetical protein
MDKPRIFLGSSGKQAKLLQAITRGLEDVADVEPWTTTFNPGRSTLCATDSDSGASSSWFAQRSVLPIEKSPPNGPLSDLGGVARLIGRT